MQVPNHRTIHGCKSRMRGINGVEIDSMALLVSTVHEHLKVDWTAGLVQSCIDKTPNSSY